MEEYVSFHDVHLTVHDVLYLEPETWLHDKSVSFALHYMNDERKREQGASAPEVVVVDAAIVSALKLTCDDAEERGQWRKGLGVGPTTHILAPVNDNSSLRTHGPVSSHWSLLYIDVKRAVAVHFDSMQPKNSRDASRTAEVLMEMCTGKEADAVTVLEATGIPQQRNGYDCGVYACLFAARIHEHLTRPCAHPSPLDDLESPFYAHLRASVTGDACDAFRAETRRTIMRLIKEKKG